jgi:gentisate 1,2-dioxygenase
VVWLDALDLPLIYRLEASYAVEGAAQTPANAPDRSQTAYRRAGLVPYASTAGPGRPAYPLLRYPWGEVRQALLDLAAGLGPDEPVHLAYVNPESGEACLPVMGFSAQMLRPGEEVAPRRRSVSAVVHVVEGEGESEVDGETLAWGEADTLAVPTHAEVRHRAGPAGACLFHVDDAPLHRALGIYEEFEATP